MTFNIFSLLLEPIFLGPRSRRWGISNETKKCKYSIAYAKQSLIASSFTVHSSSAPSHYRTNSYLVIAVGWGITWTGCKILSVVFWSLILDLMGSKCAASADQHLTRCSWTQTLLIPWCLEYCSKSYVSFQPSTSINQREAEEYSV